MRFLARGGGYTIFLTDDEAVLTLRKSQPGMSRFGKFGFSGRLKPFGRLDRRGRRWPSLADDLKSLWPSLIPDLSQMVPEPNGGKGGMVGGPESQPPQVLRMRLLGGNAKGSVVGLGDLPGHSNYFIGNDPKKWRTNVPSYAKVKYEGVYTGVDLVYYGNQRQLEYDFVVAPGTDLTSIRLKFNDAENLRIDKKGDLLLAAEGEQVRLQKPQVYQEANGTRKTVEGRYWMAAANTICFRVDDYDRSKPLIIDPVLVYSTYLGGDDNDQGLGIAVDDLGNASIRSSAPSSKIALSVLVIRSPRFGGQVPPHIYSIPRRGP